MLCDVAPMLEPIGEDIWGVPGQIAMAGGVRLPLRATVVRLPDGALWLHSPVRLSDEVAAALDALGPVRHIVAPSGFHHLYAGEALRRWPDAVLSKSSALVKKRPDLAATHILGEGAPPWGDALLALPIAGAPSVAEVCFLHRATGTLLVTDALFNVTSAPNWISRLFYAGMGIGAGPAMGRLFKFVHRDRAVVGPSLRAILSHDIRCVVPCHGDVLQADAHATLAKVWSDSVAA